MKNPTLLRKLTDSAAPDSMQSQDPAAEEAHLPLPDGAAAPVGTLPVLQQPSDGTRWQNLSLTASGFVSASDDRSAIRNPITIRDESPPPIFAHMFATLERLSAGLTVIGVTSAVQGEGKTTVALHLARYAAESSYGRVCLIDLSLGEDELCRRIGVAPAPGGVIRFLESDLPLSVLQWSGPLNLAFFAAGKSPANPAKIARSPRIPELISALRDEYDIVIVDLPAVSTDNATPIAKHLDGLIVVARAGATPRRVINRAMDALGRENLIGLVLNQVPPVAERRRTSGSAH